MLGRIRINTIIGHGRRVPGLVVTGSRSSDSKGESWSGPSRTIASSSTTCQRVFPLPSKLSYLNVPGEFPLTHRTIGDLVDDAAETFGDAEALIVLHQGIRRTFTQLRKEADDFAEGLLATGLEKGDRIGIWGPNTHQWYVTHMAAAKAGLVLVNINPAYQPRELKYALQKVGVKCIVMDDKFRSQNYYEILANVVPELRESDPGKVKSGELPALTTVISMSPNSLKGAYSFDEISKKGQQLNQELPIKSTAVPRVQKLREYIKFDDVFNIQFTSGTTGNPKGVMLSHHNVVNNSFLVGKRFELTQQDKVCIAVPFYHCYGQVAAMLSSLQRGAPIVAPAPHFDPKLTMKAVVDEKCTVMYGTPTMHVDMTSLPEIKDLDLSSLRLVITSGSICPEDLARSMTRIYGAKVGTCFGLTETSPVFFQTLPSDSDESRAVTIGYPQEHTEVKIVDENGNIVPVGQPGELCARGYMTMLGYWDDPAKTAESLKPDTRWFHTGDTFMMLDSGHGRIVGRIKEMIIRGGENIYPREVEDFLHLNPKIADAYVFGVPDDRLGEEVGVWIRLNAGVQMSEKDVRDYCKGQIAHFKIPKYILFRSDFPTTISGKIQKFKMTEETVKLLNLKSAQN